MKVAGQEVFFMAAQQKGFREIKDETVKNGGYHLNLHFDLHGNSANSLKDIMVAFVGKLTQEDGVNFGIGEIDEPIEHEKLYSTTAKVTLLVKDFTTMVRLCAAYGPIAVEIEDPLDIRLPVHEAQESLLLVSSISQQFTNIMLKKAMTDEEKIDFERKMSQRMALGKRMLEKEGQKN